MLTMICKGYRQGLRWRIKAATRKQPGPQRRTVKVSTQRTKVFLVRYLFDLLIIWGLFFEDVHEMNFMLRLSSSSSSSSSPPKDRNQNQTPQQKKQSKEKKISPRIRKRILLPHLPQNPFFPSQLLIKSHIIPLKHDMYRARQNKPHESRQFPTTQPRIRLPRLYPRRRRCRIIRFFFLSKRWRSSSSSISDASSSEEITQREKKSTRSEKNQEKSWDGGGVGAIVGDEGVEGVIRVLL